MKIQCPKCKQIVPSQQVNVSTDLALCPVCNEGFKISETFDMDTVNAGILNNPPKGAWFRTESDKVVVGATTRSPYALLLVPFICVWSGGTLSGIYGSQIVKWEFDLFLSVFGIPFLMGTVLLAIVTLMAICGKVEVFIGKVSTVFVGIGSWGWKRNFDWVTVETIRETGAGMGYPGSHQGAIVIEGKEHLKFGTGLNDQRRCFVLNVLKYLRVESR